MQQFRHAQQECLVYTRTTVYVACGIVLRRYRHGWLLASSMLHRVVLRWNCAKVIANIDDLAISIWTLKVIDKLSQIDDI